jgi:hypothetical protein
MGPHADGLPDIVVTKAMRGGEHPVMGDQDTGTPLTRAEDVNDALLSKLELGTDLCPTQTIASVVLGTVGRIALCV